MGSSVGWLVGCLVCWLVDWGGWLIGYLLVCQFDVLLIWRFVG